MKIRILYSPTEYAINGEMSNSNKAIGENKFLFCQLGKFKMNTLSLSDADWRSRQAAARKASTERMLGNDTSPKKEEYSK